ncbi:MAG: AbrB/MazE/SpoVT family DNA-binding domain-containing protein [Candidatus Bathyarchaeia archaeon]
MNLKIKIRIGKRYAIYLPRAVVEALDLKEGEELLLGISGKALVLEALGDPIQLALSGEKFASITPEGVEAISLEEQAG